MEQATTISERLNAVLDQLKAASTAADADARTRLISAIEHAQQVETELQTRIAQSDGRARADDDEAAAHLNVMAENGRRALDQTGTSLRSQVNTLIASARRAIDSYEGN